MAEIKHRAGYMSESVLPYFLLSPELVSWRPKFQLHSKVWQSRVTACRAWRHTPLIPALRRQRQANLCEFEASLVYKVSSRTARPIQRTPVSKNKTKQNKNKKTKKTKNKNKHTKNELQPEARWPELPSIPLPPQKCQSHWVA